ncbi:4'-phosphopantetheinyl transferase superfamily protein [Cytophagaceae bacterium ABcell3]|nr:4'-phosphopantetheinyl transferase superfamily protein [Cytophagaceae bacterium ABcell3]
MSQKDLSVQLFLADWHQILPTIHECSVVLSKAENERAALFHKRRYAEEFIACRILLRKVLYSVTGVSPEKLEILYTEQGKPYLVLDSHKDLKFSISHSSNMCLIGISHLHEIGVDIEKIRPLDHSTLSARFYSKAEIANYQSLQGDEQELAFFDTWTRKEACAKANGGGLRFKISELDTGKPGTLFKSFVPGNCKDSFYVKNVKVTESFSAAVALLGKENFEVALSDFQIKPYMQ